MYLKEDYLRNKAKYSLKARLKLVLGIASENEIVVTYLYHLRNLEYYTANKKMSTMPAFMYHLIAKKRMSNKYKLTIPINVVGKGIKIAHINAGIIINCKKMGDNCSISSGCVIGNVNTDDNKPTIGDNVSFYIGSMAFGNITIGDNATIAPGAIVTKNVIPNTVVAGVPAKQLKINK